MFFFLDVIHEISMNRPKKLPSSHIAGFFDHQSIWRESINALDLWRSYFWLGDQTHCSLYSLAICTFVGLQVMARLKIVENERLKILFPQFSTHNVKFLTEICFWPIKLLNWLSISLQGISEYLRFFPWRYSPMKRNFWRYYFWLGVVRHAQPCSAMPKLVKICQMCI